MSRRTWVSLGRRAGFGSSCNTRDATPRQDRPKKKLKRGSDVRKLEPTPEESDDEMDEADSEPEGPGGSSQAKKPRTKAARKAAALSKPLVSSCCSNCLKCLNLTSIALQSPGAPGTVARMQLYNIMCHKNLEIDMIEKVNFVTGQNGSGFLLPCFLSN